MKIHAANHSDLEIVNCLTVAWTFVLKVRKEPEASGGCNAICDQ